ncbi:MAG TPA: bifunctional UDP-N-acetylglucosamine diphosphorylase/glucosamine-1-phosphate N-acetyltransferase GlmU [Ktedonobacteraceae bacterium]
MNTTYATVVLAAGRGTRMRSELPKVLHQVAGLPLLAHVLEAIAAIPAAPALAGLGACTGQRPVIVVGHGAEQIAASFGQRCRYARQSEQLGTGHAVLMAQAEVEAQEPRPGIVLVCYGDTPLVTGEVLARLLAEHCARQATITFLTALAQLPSDYGRVVRDAEGHVREIVEVRRASEEQRGIREVNSGVYCFQRAWLWPALRALPRNPSGEYYLTDLVGIAARQEQASVATVCGSLEETVGVNDRVQLAGVERLLRQRILERHMYAGVTIIDPATTYIGAQAQIGRDTVLLPGTMISGATQIGTACRIGPGTTIEDSTIGDGCVIRQSVLEATIVEEDVHIGPFSHCRPGAYLARNVRLGNFAEVKNACLGPDTAMHHMSYLGDATVGAEVNIGAGTITCNYDGVQKHRTIVGDGAFIGSDTMLVAPVTIGEHAITGAGSVVRHDVPPGAVVAGVPARLLRSSQPADSSIADGGKKE